MRVRALPTADFTNTLPKLFMAIDGEGEVTKACGVQTYVTKAQWSGVTGADYCW